MVKVYNTSRELVADIADAYAINYEMRENEIWTAGFTIAADDPRASEIAVLRYAEIYDDDERVELFRIKKITYSDGEATEIRVDCEHVLATLIDAKVSAITYSGPGTAVSIADVLALQSNWALGTCDFNAQFLYEWGRGTSLWACLCDIVGRLQAGYLWTVNTNAYPWTLNLVDDETQVSAYIDYGRNLQTIEKEEDVTDLVTRLWAFGAGAGTEQVDISSVNPTGLKYIDTNTGTYGVIEKYWVDQDYTTVAELYTAAVDYAAELSTPKLTYRVSAADLTAITGESIDTFTLGKLLRIDDPALDVTASVRIVSVSKSDVTGSPGAISIELGNKTREFDLKTYVQANDLSAVKISNIPGGVAGGLLSAPGDAGLYVTTDYLGYWDSSAWATYLDSAGRLYAESGSYYFRFNPVAGTLSIKVSALDVSATTGIIDTLQIADLAVTDGKIATLSVSKLTAGTIDAETITLAETTGSAICQGKTGPSDTDPGFWLGYAAGASMFTIGDAANYMKWTGTELIVVGSISGTIAADLDMSTHTLYNVGDVRSVSAAYPNCLSIVNGQWLGYSTDGTVANSSYLSLSENPSLKGYTGLTMHAQRGNVTIQAYDDIILYPGNSSPHAAHLEYITDAGGTLSGYMKFVIDGNERYVRFNTTA
jgi:phage minor structural protein